MLTQNENVILHILHERPNLGKTALMKIIYFLQHVKRLELEYDFDIYTYGPYASDVTDTLDNLISDGFVSSVVHSYRNYSGYALSISETGKEMMHLLSDEDEKEVQEILTFADGKSAKDLELHATIVFINHLLCVQKGTIASKDDVIKTVHDIKPHFDKKTILEAYDSLARREYISS
jgi:uncharacterized protein YwgA